MENTKETLIANVENFRTPFLQMVKDVQGLHD
jgi:hypothetical protein